MTGGEAEEDEEPPWAELTLASPLLDGWVQTAPYVTSPGAEVQVLDAAPYWHGGLFDGWEALLVRLRVAPAEGEPFEHFHNAFERARKVDLRTLEGLTAYIRQVEASADRLGEIAHLAEHKRRRRFGAAGGPPLTSYGLHLAQRLSQLRTAIIDSVRENENAAWGAADLPFMLEMAFETGRATREAELMQSFEVDAQRGRNFSDVNRRKSDKSKITRARLRNSWEAPCKVWVRYLISNWSFELGGRLNFSNLADKIIENWPARPFSGGPASRDGSDVPEYNRLKGTILPKWRSEGEIALPGDEPRERASKPGSHDN